MSKTPPREQRFPAGAFIFREGDSARFAYQLKEGVVEIVKHTPAGLKVLTEVAPGTVFGEMALLDDAPRSASARARDDATVLEIDRDAFLAYLSGKPQTAFQMMRKLAEYARRTSNQSSLTEPAPATTTDQPAAVGVDDRTVTGEIADTDAIYDRPMSRPALMMLLGMLAIVAAAVGFLAFTEIDVTVSARGRLTTRVPSVVIQARANAVVDQVLVERGQTVNRGDIIARLDGTVILTNLAVIQEQLAASEQRLRRFALEQELIANGKPVPADHKLTPVDADILGKRLEEYRSRIAAFHTKVDRIGRDIESEERVIAIYREQLDAKSRIEGVYDQLYKQSASTLLKTLSSKDARLTMLSQLTTAETALQASHSLRDSMQADWRAFSAEWLSKLAEQLAAETEKHTRLSGELRKLSREAEHLEVRAPVAGIVLDLPKVTDGSVVAEGAEVVTLVRVDVPLIMEVDVDPKDVSDLRLGVPVSIKLDSLAFQQYGDLPGSLTFVTEDTLPNHLDGSAGAVYRAQVVLDKDIARYLPPGFQLAPGMLGQADMKVGLRQLSTYFTAPLMRTVGRAFREPG